MRVVIASGSGRYGDPWHPFARTSSLLAEVLAAAGFVVDIDHDVDHALAHLEGVPLAPERRTAAVEWARESGAVLIEDDYDGEFRYDRQAVGALQALDPERVVYTGTASKSLAPGLRRTRSPRSRT